VVYTIQAWDNGEAVSGFSTHDCPLPDGSGPFQGGWKVNFVQP
jgi:hypothetical protein